MIALDPSNTTALMQRGFCWRKMDKFENAIQDYSAIISSNPSNIRAINNRAYCLAKINKFQDNNVDKMTVYSAIFSLNYYKGFSVLRTLSIDETALFVCNSIHKMIKENIKGLKNPYYSNTTEIHCLDDAPDKNYINVIKKIKKDNITPNNIDEIMLSQIPGVSSTIAIVIINKFETLSNLLNKLNEDDKCLCALTYTNSKNQTRKLNKSCIQNIVKFLLKK